MPAPRPSAADALPNLLTSRLQFAHGGKGPAKDAPNAPDMKVAMQGHQSTEPPQKLPEAYSMPLRIHNTFIDTCAERSPSLERFYREREVHTCPSVHVGRLRRLFQEPDPSLWGFDDDAETQLPSENPETRSVSEASPDNAARQPIAVSLAASLGLPSQPPPLPAWGSQVVYANSLLGATPCIPEGISAVGDVGAPGVLLPAVAREMQAVPAPPARPAPGSAELPSIGSAGHAAGECKPCAFFYTAGCANGLTCQFCHLCDAEERKRRRRAKCEARRVEKLRRAEQAASGP